MSIEIVIAGGTHGNEFSGIRLIEQWQAQPERIQRPGCRVTTVFTNPKAHEANRRYLDQDLNRQFTQALLQDTGLAQYEQSRAKVLNAQLGPKGNSQTDLIIDLHNTTSDMGPTLILLDRSPWDRQLAAYVLANMPEARILLEDVKPRDEMGYLCSVGQRGVMVEVGPQPQSVVRQDVLEQMDTMTQLILDFTSLEARGELPVLPAEVGVFRYVESFTLPLDAQGRPEAMIHKDLQDKDFEPLAPGAPIFQYFDGRVAHFEGERVLYPHFINEAAYYDNHGAFSLAEKLLLSVPASVAGR